MNTIRLVLPLLLLAMTSSFAVAARAATGAAIQGILITASNERGASDQRLTSYEPTLRRILRFESYRFLGEGSATIGATEKGQISLGAGHQLGIETESSDGSGIHVKVRWVADGKALMNTGLVLRAGVPAVLGGPSTGNKGEVFAVILIAR